MTNRTGLSRRMPASARALGIVLVLVSAAGFGSGALFVQPLYDAEMGPLTILWWRFATAALFTWGFLLLSARRRRALRSLSRRRVAVLALLGVLYVGVSYTFIGALEFVPITLTEIIAYTYPALVAVLATRFARRLEGRRAWIALGISLLGVGLTLGGIPSGEIPPLWGLVLAFTHPIVYSIWIITQARLAGERPSQGARGTRGETAIIIPPADAETTMQGPDPSPAAAIMTTTTAFIYAVLLLGSGGTLSPLDVSASLWPALLGLGLVSTAIAIQAFYAGVRRVGGARAALISTIEPVYAVVLAVILFGEHLAPMQIAGGALVIFGVILAETGRRDAVGSGQTERAGSA